MDERSVGGGTAGKRGDELRGRTKRFAIAVIRLIGDLPGSLQADVIGRQLLRSGTSVGANYRAACLARSRADFVSKVGVAAEEADETSYWLELLSEAEITSTPLVRELAGEARQLTAILVSSGRTAKENLPAREAKRPVGRAE